MTARMEVLMTARLPVLMPAQRHLEPARLTALMPACDRGAVAGADGRAASSFPGSRALCC
ncbi:MULTISPECIES: hypothetical protein [Corynebacterium]|uniref:hypothetical protein n=1 Tax=Corynebacterium TaxID=1716 RepID=UPI0016597C46|nr:MULTISPECIES: hypothetical protein [Corynebacterium]QNP92072.1 hypothetical protein IAU67_08700 [Corynebacterium zhongnanshanii]